MSLPAVSVRLPRQRGQGMVEYGLVLLFVAIALIASLIAMQGSVASLFDSVVNGITGATGG